MMIDFALEAERKEGKPPEEAIYQACLLRFRPIMMTTMAALLGGLPLALGRGTGSELRRPLGITIVGGLLLSQMLTLYTTPVVYLWFDRLAQRAVALPRSATPSMPSRCRGGLTHEHLRSLHPRPVAPRCWRWRCCWRAPWPISCCRWRRCRRWSSPPSPCRRGLPGASPETMASAVATPLERQFGTHRRHHRDDLDQPARLHQHHPAVRSQPQHRRRRARRAGGHQRRRAASCPPTCPAIPTYRKVNPADAPILILALTSDTHDRRRGCTTPPTPSWRRRLSQVEGVGQVIVGGGAKPAVRVEVNPTQLDQLRHRHWTRCAPRSARANANRPKGEFSSGDQRCLRHCRQRPASRRRPVQAADRRLSQRRGRAARPMWPT